MKCSPGVSNFLEEISSLSHSVVFLYFFALLAEEGFLISSCYSLELCILKGMGDYLKAANLAVGEPFEPFLAFFSVLPRTLWRGLLILNFFEI